MADKKVSELTTITGADTAADDFFLIVDTSGSVSKKISRAELTESIEIGLNEIETDLSFGDNVKANFGDSADLQIYHDGSNSYIQDKGTGDLFIDGDNNLTIRTGDGLATKAKFTTIGAVELYYNNSKKFETTNTGIDVTGTVDIQSSTGGKLILTTTDTSGATGEDVGSIDFYSSDASTGSTGVQARILGELDSNGDSTALQFFTGLSTGSGSPTLRKRIQIDGATATNGNISFYEDTGTTAKFYWDAHNERLGIGTTSPSYILDVTGASANVGKFKRSDAGTTEVLIDTSGSGDAQLVFADNGTDSWAIGRDNTNGDFVIAASGALGTSNAINIESGGNVGIGTTSPVATLQIKTQADGNAAFQNSTSLAGGVKINAFNDAASASVPFEIDGSSLQFNIAAVEKMRIDSSGNVGIGTTAAKEKLDSRGAAVFSGDNATGTNAFGTSAGLLLSTASDNSAARITAVSNGSNNRNLELRTLASGSAVTAMTLDSSGNVGINETSPSSYHSNANNLVVADSGSGGISIVTGTSSGGYIYFADGTSGDQAYRGQIFYSHSDNSMNFATAGVQRARIDSSGNVGIGTTTPVGLLDLDGGSSAFTIQLKETSGAYQRMGFQKSNDLLQMGEFNNDGSVFTPILNVSGNGDKVGIGTSPDRKLHVFEGDSTITPNSNGHLVVENSGVSFINILGGNGSVKGILMSGNSVNADGRLTYDDNSRNLEFWTASSERMRIDSSGNVGIAETSPAAKFEVLQSAFGTNSAIFNSSHSTTPQGIKVDFSVATPDNNSQKFLTCEDATAERCVIYSDGDLANHDGTYGTLSDRHYKTDIENARSYWDDWKNIQFHTFTKGGKKQFGVIADELETVFPSLVHTSPDENHPDGESQWVDTMNLLQIAGKVIQELQAKNEALEARITALET